MKISFITPVYNSVAYIDDCINSVLKQSNPNWELVLIDDGSTDGSGELCDKYASQDNRVKVIHKENSGQFDSRLQGIRIASGNYCAGLDSDDYLDGDCVEKLIKIAEKDDFDAILWNTRLIEDGKELYCGSKKKYGEYTQQDLLDYIASTTDYSFCNKAFQTVLYKNAYFGNVPINAKHSEDYIMIFSVACCSRKAYAMDEVMYNYRQIESSVTHSFNGRRAIDYLNSSMCVRDICRHYNMLTSRYVQIENKALVVSVGNCLKQAYRNNELSRDEISIIRRHPMYVQLKSYESISIVSLDIFVFMKLFRYRCYWLMHLMNRKRR